MLRHGLADYFADGHTGRQAGIGILEYYLHLRTKGVHFGVGQLIYILAVEVYRAFGCGLQPKNGAAERGFAATRFANYAQRCTALYFKAYIVHRLYERHGLAEEILLGGEIFF